jgi:hypothetical protein
LYLFYHLLQWKFNLILNNKFKTNGEWNSGKGSWEERELKHWLITEVIGIILKIEVIIPWPSNGHN